jgi:16S rRNA processing protein RimM
VAVGDARRGDGALRAERDLKRGDRLVTVGRVGRPHGLDGSFVVEEPSDVPDRFAEGAELYVNGERAEILDAKRVGGGRLALRLDRPAPRGATLAVRADALPPPDEDAYYVFQLVGLEVVEEGGRKLGRVSDVLPYPANDVLELDSGVALPLVEDCVRQVDLEARRIVVATGFADPG